MIHETFMQRCIELARLGAGNTAPNPLVGSVVVHNGHIIGEGYHQVYGGPHAEVNAILSVKNKNLLSQSTLYVNLEPCAHFGKTPPCADLILEHKIPRVVIGCRDPFSEVDGKGIERLEKGYVEVITGILEKECKELNKRFLTFHLQKRPWILLKWAKSKDGFIGQPDKRIMISNALVKTAVHKWRSEEAAIMAGTNTVSTDNPSLTVRDWFGKNPTRIILDQHGRLEENLHVFNADAPTLIFNARNNSEEMNLMYIKVDFSKDILPQVLNMLYEKKIISVMVEGGAALLNTFITQNVWDEAIVITGKISLKEGIRAPEIPGRAFNEEMIDSDLIQFYRNNNPAHI